MRACLCDFQQGAEARERNGIHLQCHARSVGLIQSIYLSIYRSDTIRSARCQGWMATMRGANATKISEGCTSYRLRVCARWHRRQCRTRRAGCLITIIVVVVIVVIETYVVFTSSSCTSKRHWSYNASVLCGCGAWAAWSAVCLEARQPASASPSQHRSEGHRRRCHHRGSLRVARGFGSPLEFVLVASSR